MTEKIEQHEIVLCIEPPDISAERIYLAGSSCYKTFLFAVNLAECISRETRYIFASSRLCKFFQCLGNIMLGASLFDIISDSACFESKPCQMTSDFESDTSG